jgi:predicted nucleic acid-binding protein
MLDGHESSAFNKVKSEYPIQQCKRKVIHQAITDFQKFLEQYGINIVKSMIKPHEIYEYCLKYALETPDAVQVLCATRNSDYLVTIDRRLIASEVKEIKIIDPGNLMSKRELRFY